MFQDQESIYVGIFGVGRFSTGMKRASDQRMAAHDAVRVGDAPIEVIPRSDWIDVDRTEWALDNFKAKNQGQYPECGGYSTSRFAEMLILESQSVKVELNPSAIYAFAGGNGRNGTVIADLLSAASEKGIPPDDGSVQPHTYRFDPSYIALGSKYKVKSSRSLKSFDEIASEIIRGKFVEYGNMIGNNWNADKSTGIVPPYRGGGGGHARCADSLKRFPDGIWRIGCWNSWDDTWGYHGRYWEDESYFKDWFEAFSGEAVVEIIDNGEKSPVAT